MKRDYAKACREHDAFLEALWQQNAIIRQPAAAAAASGGRHRKSASEELPSLVYDDPTVRHRYPPRVTAWSAPRTHRGPFQDPLVL